VTSFDAEGAAVAEEPLQCYFVDSANNQQGPVGSSEIVRLVRNGTIRRDTLIWHTGMTDWRPAGEVSGLTSLFTGAAPPARPPASPRMAAMADSRIAAAASTDGPTDGLIAVLGVWGLFWRSVLTITALFVIPAPWVYTMLCRYLIENTSLPDGRRLTFSGKPLDIWYVFMGLAALALIGNLVQYAILITLPLEFILSVLALRWVCEKIGSEDGSVQIAFTGSIWGYVGWNLLLMLSVITIIGWAWVMQFMVRWICRNVSGTEAFDFTGTGLSILWRTIVFGLASIFLIPVPWMLRWYTVWFMSQVRAGEPQHA
jgi:hypothetical protein